MEKIKLLSDNLMTAYKEKNLVAKSLYSTLKGEYTTSIKKGATESDQTLEKIAKKMSENAKENFEISGSEDAKIEMELLKPFLPTKMSKEEVTLIVNSVISENQDKFLAAKTGSNKSMGFFVGQIMKKANGNADIVDVNEVLIEAMNA